MDCQNCIYCDRCKQPNKNRPACLIYTRYNNLLRLAKIPKRYRRCNVDNLPFKESNPEAYRKVMKYCNDILHYTEDGHSIYLYSNPTKGNEMGTGTGKTTAACSILNKFLEEYVWWATTNRKNISNVPALFVKCSDFQNKYTEQFRNQMGASTDYYIAKSNMMLCNLLVLDDIAIRNCSQGFMAELYEVINHRVSEELPTIYTSNISREKLDEVLDQRIQSRMYEHCIPIELSGEDNRF